MIRRGHRCLDVVGHMGGPGSVCGRDRDEELVSAGTVRGVGRCRGDRVGDHGDDQVAESVPVLIIERLQLVDIDPHDRAQAGVSRDLP